MKNLIGVALIGLSLLGCNNNYSNCGVAYFGGEIINPNSDHLVLYDSSQPIDTLYLDENSRFFQKIENLNPGLYSFVHGEEYQIMLLEPDDSIMIRLNTFDFDESLVFTGNGSKKNNYLLGLFIDMEKENRELYDLAKETEPSAFGQMLDSLSEKKRSKLAKFNEKYPNSTLFNKVANACIDYSNYAQREVFPFRYFGTKYTKPEMMPEGFYSYRSGVDYNDESLKDFYPYYNFLFPHFSNLALPAHKSNNDSGHFNRYEVNYNLRKLKLIDSLISSEAIKNNLLKYSTRNFLSNSGSPEHNEVILTSFLQKCSNNDHTEYIQDFYENLSKLEKGNVLPEISLRQTNGQVVKSSTAFSKPTVIYFWSKSNKRHAKDSHEKAAVLAEKFPEIDFVSINVNAQKHDSWMRLMAQNNFDKKGQFILQDPEAATKTLALYNIYKVLVIDDEHRIVKSNANFFWDDLSETLADLSDSKVYR